MDGPTVATGAPFATTTGYTTVPAGTWSLQAKSVASPSVAAGARVSVASGSVTSVLLLDGRTAASRSAPCSMRRGRHGAGRRGAGRWWWDGAERAPAG